MSEKCVRKPREFSMQSCVCTHYQETLLLKIVFLNIYDYRVFEIVF